MLSFFALLAAFAALGLAAWLRERVVRLEEEVRALRAREPGTGTGGFPLKVNTGPEPGAAPAPATDAPPVAFPAPPVAFAPPPPPLHPSKQITDAAASAEPSRAAAAVREGAEGIPPLAPPPAARAARVDWESFVGVRLFSWIAGIFLVIGAVLFLRYSIERGWLSEPVRMAIGLAVGSALLVLCELKAARRYPVTANALDAAGLAILFATLYAAHARWDILGPGAAFLALALVAGLAVTLAVRHDSTFIAVLGLLAGFASPVLLGTLWTVLFPFLALLGVGLFLFASLRQAPLLHVLAALATFAVLLTWCVRSLTPDLLGPGLAAIALLAAFYLFAPALSARLASPAPLPAAAAGLGLFGHVLFLWIASQRGLVVPPGAFEAIALAAVTAGATLAGRRAGTAFVHAAGLGLAVLAVTAFVLVAPHAPWPAAGLAAAAGIALWGAAAYVFDGSLAYARAAAVGLVAAQGAAIVVSLAPGSPPLRAVLLAQALFLVALFAVAAGGPEPRVSVLAAGPAMLAAYAWGLSRRRPAPGWEEEAIFAGAIWLLFVLHPIVLGRRAGRERAPYLAAVLASAGLFPLLRGTLESGGYRPVIGLLPAAMALGMAALLVRLLTLGVPPGEDRPRLALVAGATLAFLTVAVPLQFEKEWATLGWALLGAALAWLWGRIRHRGLVVWSLALLAAAFVRLALNPAVLTYHARAATPVFNWYLWAYPAAAAALFAGAALLRRGGAPWPALVRLLPAAGIVLLFVLLNLEIADLFAEGRRLAVNPFSTSLAEGLAYTLGWALFAIALLVGGILKGSRAARIASLALLVVTVLKCFLFDLARLGGLYRVASFVGLAVCLALVALLLQRFVLRREGAGVSTPAPGSSG